MGSGMRFGKNISTETAFKVLGSAGGIHSIR